ncbi:MAG: tRNA pseudouridine(55) synthase TruB, partial [Rubrivivax sp.]|nr:tRNA pseudouridine(55) synthase TruB [Rubrivivax sp.]
SKGTYIRTLAEDMGAALGCGAHLAALRRTACGPLEVNDAIRIDAFEGLSPEARAARLLAPESLLADWPAITLPADEAARFLTGLRRRLAPARHADTAQLRVHGPDGAFLGSAHITAGELIADRLLSPDEVRACAAPFAAPQAVPGVPA